MYRTFIKRLAFILAITIASNALLPGIALALTSGPQQPEASGFTPLNTSEMVDLFTGDLKYNIPLLDIPGHNSSYPISLSYNSPGSVEEEASMVGYGWNLSIGNISRNVQGVPDDFNGDKITTQADAKANITYGIGGIVDFELVTLDFFKANLGYSATVMFNSYKGLGFALGPNFSFSFPKNDMFSGGYNSETSTFEGRSWSAGFGLNTKFGKANQYSAGIDLTVTGNNLNGDRTFNTKVNASAYGNGASVNLFEKPADIYFNNRSMKGFNLKTAVKVGLTAWTLAPEFGGKAFYTSETLMNRNIPMKNKSYGSMYCQNQINNNLEIKGAIFDFKRENDGPIREHQKYLHTNSQNFDDFIVNTQGLNGSFKLHRSDIGVFKDPNIIPTRVIGKDLSGQVASGNIVDVGTDARNMTTITSNFNPLNFSHDYGFQSNIENKDFEPYYFKFDNELTGEVTKDVVESNDEGKPLFQSYNYIKDDEPIYHDVSNEVSIENVYSFKNKPHKVLKNLITNKNDIVSLGVQGKGLRLNRKPRTKSIQGFTNRDLNPKDNVYPIQLFNLKVHPRINNQVLEEQQNIPPQTIMRNFGSDKLSGFTINDEQGDRWVFGLPILNLTKEDYIFSVNPPGNGNKCTPNVPVSSHNDKILYKVNAPDGDNYFDRKVIPSHATSFGLTSIVGQDYIDMNVNDGPPNAKDKGKWFRFDYFQTNNTSNHYKWRTPYSGATYNSGSRSVDGDDKANFSYGEREQYYIKTIESPTHIAKFKYSKRQDGRGAANKIQNEGDILVGAYSYKLDKIELFANDISVPVTLKLIKSIEFEYNYSTWPGILNTDVPNSGKLTLIKLKINNYSSTRGGLSPYKFEYYNNAGPQYGFQIQDRWGMYRPNFVQASQAVDCENQNLYSPYVRQFETNANNPSIQEQLDEEASEYHLKSITLPSGAKLKFDIGRDHYGFVQDRKASQMFNIEGIQSVGNNHIPVTKYTGNDDPFKVFFRLEKEIDENDVNKDIKLGKYFDDLYMDELGYQVYFKILTDITGKGEKEFVTGYAHTINWGFGPSENGKYKYAYVTLLPVDEQIKGGKYHPFLFFTWQEIKLNFKNLLLPSFITTEEEKQKSIQSRVQKFADKLGDILNVFQSFYKRCIDDELGSNMDFNYSFIRLNSPDQFKYGGGIQVKKISLIDTWDKEETPDYGLIYDYTSEEEIEGGSHPEKIVVSNGVALNEPFIGSEENAYKYVESYTDQIRGNTDNIFNQEFPLCDEYFPAANVGYSKITVRSLASDHLYKRKLNGNDYVDNLYNIPKEGTDNLSTSGQKEYLFYTAKDYPVIVEHAPLKSRRNAPPITFRLFKGSFTANDYLGTQGHAVITNDMHGMKKADISFEQNKDGSFNPIPIKKIEYFYKDKPKINSLGGKRKEVNELNNNVQLYLDYVEDHINPTKALIKDGEIGVQRDVISDEKYAATLSAIVGADINVNVIPILIYIMPIITGIPDYEVSTSQARTYVMTKHIHKSGILERIVVTDGQSKIETINEVFDPFTGKAVLTKTTNMFDKPVYNYVVPEYLNNNAFGAAYKNEGIKFSIITPADLNEMWEGILPSKEYKLKLSGIASPLYDKLINGDEFIVSVYDITEGNPIEFKGASIGYFDRMSRTDPVVIIDATLAAKFVQNQENNKKYRIDFKLVRSGARNLMDKPWQEISSLSNPLLNYIKTLEHPVVNNVQLPNTVTSVNMEEILDATAYDYTDVWNYNPNYFPINVDNLWSSFLVYKYGLRGIYLPKAQYKFNTSRKYDNSFEKHGVYNTFNFFKKDEPYYQNTSEGEKWICQSEITKYSTNLNPLESKNALNIYSSKLENYIKFYSTDDFNFTPPYHLTSECSNSRYYESAFTSFEPTEFVTNESEISNVEVSKPITRTENYSHFDIHNKDKSDISENTNVENRFTTEVYNIIGKTDILPSGSNEILIDKPWDGNTSLAQMEISLRAPLVQYNYKLIPTNVSPIIMASGKFKNKEMTKIAFGYPNAQNLPMNTIDGRVLLYYETTFSENVNNVDANGEFAHSGKYSLPINNSNKVLQQSTLKLTTNKTYHFCCWLNDGDNASCYKDLNDHMVKVIIHSGNNQVELKPSGFMIEDWQRVDADFVYQGGILKIEFDKGSLNALRVDDVRIHPKEGQMQSYVYDAKYARLMYMLDFNNYYSKYNYDGDGNISSVQKETERGIKTIKENKSYIKINP